MRSLSLNVGAIFALAGLSAILACSSNSSRSGFGESSSGSSGASSGGILGGGGDGGSSGGPQCAPDPSNYDIPGNNCDDDADGTVDNPPACDGSLSTGGSAEDFAKAIGICDKASDKGYGLVSAEFTQGTSSDAPPSGQHGILAKFGNVLKPREGKQLGVLSSGYAQEFDGAPGKSFMKNYKEWDDPFGGPSGSVPPGFPKPAQNCAISNEVHDVVGVKLKLKAPPNSSGVKFDFNFFTSEWPAFVCSRFNDAFIAYLESKGTTDNISFDKDKNPVSVNNGFFDRCTSGVMTGCAPGAVKGTSNCPGGPDELAGTGFGLTDQYCKPFGNDTSTGGGATGWLTSQAPITAGEEFTLTFIVWDTGDSQLDSSVLLDNFTWAQGEVTTATDRPPR